MDKQELRNELCEIEDKARHLRKVADSGESAALADLIVQFIQLIREEIVN